MPDHLRRVPHSSDGNVQVSSIGFPSPNIQRQYSPALQQQISLLNADKEAGYFLFDNEDRPVRVVLRGAWLKMMFRIVRSGILSGSGAHGLEAIVEYLVKVMGQKPGLSREMILAQLQNEYGGDMTTKMSEWDKKAVENGLQGITLLEDMSRNMMATIPAALGPTYA